MDFILEFIFDLALEGSVGIAKNKKIKNWIRYPLVFLLSSLVIASIVSLCVVGIIFILDKEISTKIAGVLFVFLDMNLIVSVIKKVRKKLSEKNK